MTDKDPTFKPACEVGRQSTEDDAHFCPHHNQCLAAMGAIQQMLSGSVGIGTRSHSGSVSEVYSYAPGSGMDTGSFRKEFDSALQNEYAPRMKCILLSLQNARKGANETDS